MTVETRRTLEEVLTAIEGSGGVKMNIARQLGVTRLTVDNYLKRWKTAQEAYERELDAPTDFARSLIVGNMRAAHNAQQVAAKKAATGLGAWEDAIMDSADAKWWLAKKAPNEFSEKKQVDLTSGGKPLIQIIGDDPDDDADA